jgi:hypothetical protein
MSIRNKTLAAVVILLLCAGCGTRTKVTVEVIKVESNEGKGWMRACLSGPNYRTTVKTKDGKVDSVCTYLGEVGDSVTGYWIEGNMDASSNGFRSN